MQTSVTLNINKTMRFGSLVAIVTSLTVYSVVDSKIPASVGDEICVSGYVMDYYCIDLGNLLDRPRFESLGPNGPLRHSVHCLVDIDDCVDSGYEILAPLEDGSGNYGRAWKLTDNTDVIAHAKKVGLCSKCNNDADDPIVEGYRATINATVLDLGSGSFPASIQVTAVQDFEVGCGGLEFEIPTLSAPTAAPTPASLVSQAPSTLTLSTQAPSTTSSSNSCNDSTVRFILTWNGRKITRDCSWVANKATAQRCDVDGVSEICSKTCGTCSDCVDSTSRMKVVWNERRITRDCTWIANRATVQRCDIEGVSDACRLTCDNCQ